MAAPTTPAEMRAHIIERLVGATGGSDRVTDAARALFERTAPKIREGLKQALALDLAVELASVEVSRIADARPEGEGHALTVAASPTSADALILSMDADAIALVVSMLFGGDSGIAAAPIRREPSPTEIVVATRVFEEIASALNKSGDRSPNLALPVPPAISGDELRKHSFRDGPGVRAVITIASPAGTGRIVLSMPQRVLLMGDQKTGQSEQWRQRFSEEVMRSGVELQATMPLARMTLGQVAGLRVGQVVEFEGDAQSQAKLSARQKTLFVCEFGKLGQNYTVRVRHPFDAGQDMMEGLVAISRRRSGIGEHK